MVIESGGWLTDQHIHAANKLLSKQFPWLQGLQSTLLSQNGGFVLVTSDGTVVQIHFCNCNHWVASSYRNQIISVYDSRPSRTMTTGLQEQLAHLYGHLESSMEDNGLSNANKASLTVDRLYCFCASHCSWPRPKGHNLRPR